MLGFAQWVKSCFHALGVFFGTVPGALKNYLNAEELFRVAVTALSAGGGIFGLLQAVVVSAGSIFPAPADAALAAAILSAILDMLRRLNQGREPVPAPVRDVRSP